MHSEKSFLCHKKMKLVLQIRTMGNCCPKTPKTTGYSKVSTQQCTPRPRGGVVGFQLNTQQLKFSPGDSRNGSCHGCGSRNAVIIFTNTDAGIGECRKRKICMNCIYDAIVGTQRISNDPIIENDGTSGITFKFDQDLESNINIIDKQQQTND
jgi:hypothetical protein